MLAKSPLGVGAEVHTKDQVPIKEPVFLAKCRRCPENLSASTRKTSRKMG